MIKSINQLVTERCNSRCQMCNIWNLGSKRTYEMTPRGANTLYGHPEFSEVEDLCISGGEPTLREDLMDLTDNIFKNLNNVKMLFLSTNGSNPQTAKDFISRYSSAVKDIYLCISLEGDKETHRKIRGVDTYDLVLDTIKQVKKAEIKNAHIVLSTTIVPENCNEPNLLYLTKLAQDLGCTHSYRPAATNSTFYRNTNQPNFLLNSDQLNFLKKYISKNNVQDQFLDILFRHIAGENTIMGNKKEGISCLAGDISVFIKPNGTIYPCINSSEIIGNIDKGIFNSKYLPGRNEPCPCCTECQVYPMLNFSKYSTRQ